MHNSAKGEPLNLIRQVFPRLSPIVAASLSLVVYIATLAPTVTFEDSGELITAAYRLGIPHEPGYPLYTLLGYIAAQVPLGSVAYRLNLLSALCTALGIFFFTLALLRTLNNLRYDQSPTQKHPDFQTQIVALIGGLLAAFAFETWEQSVITEVYGLHTAFFGMILYLAVVWTFAGSDEKKRSALLIAALVLGLASSHHPTTLLLIPILGLYAILNEPKLVMHVGFLAKCAALFLLGLTPWIYLPLASARDPVLDWGDPETLTRFLQVIGRHQYGMPSITSFQSISDHVALYFQLLKLQWPPTILILVVPGFLLLWRLQKPLLALLCGLWLFTGPLTACLTNFPIATGDLLVDDENAALTSVFFISSYLIIAFLAALGLFYFLKALPRASGRIMAALALVIPMGVIAQNWKSLDQSHHFFAQSYVHDLFQVSTPGALILVNWDPFYFPTLYYQHVENQRPDLAVVDQMLMRRSWYVRQLQRTHAPWMRLAEQEAAEFLSAVEPFELGRQYDGYRIERAYLAMINALIDKTVASGLDVFMTYRPEESIASSYVFEPMVVAYRVRAQPTALTPLDIRHSQFTAFLQPAVSNDRMARHIQKHLMTLTQERLRIATVMHLREDVLELERLQQLLQAAHDGR